MAEPVRRMVTASDTRSELANIAGVEHFPSADCGRQLSDAGAEPADKRSQPEHPSRANPGALVLQFVQELQVSKGGEVCISRPAARQVLRLLWY